MTYTRTNTSTLVSTGPTISRCQYIPIVKRIHSTIRVNIKLLHKSIIKYRQGKHRGIAPTKKWLNLTNRLIQYVTLGFVLPLELCFLHVSSLMMLEKKIVLNRSKLFVVIIQQRKVSLMHAYRRYFISSVQ